MQDAGFGGAAEAGRGSPELVRLVATDRIGERPVTFGVVAQAAELAPVAARLLVPGLLALEAEFVLRRLPDRAFGASGTLTARVMRDCVVTLDRFEQRIDERFEVEFVPEDRLTEDDDPDLPDQVVYDGSSIDLGDAAVEQLALALDPFPRKPGVEWPDETSAAAADPAPAKDGDAGAAGGTGERDAGASPFDVLRARFKPGS